MNIIGRIVQLIWHGEFKVLFRETPLTGNSSAWEGISSIPPFEPSEVSLDLDGMPRSTNTPDIGCYERNNEWFALWFNTREYHTLYGHRDENEAREFINNLISKFFPNPCRVLDAGCGVEGMFILGR